MSSHNASSSNADDSKNSSQPLKMPRQKRLKVNRACYTCRVKKIKCDGLQPCMQCRARQRPCSFSKDGPSGMEEDEYMGSSPSQTPSSMDTVQPVSDSTAFDSPREHRQRKGLGQNVSNGDREKHQSTIGLLDELCAAWPAEGCERRWIVDEHLLYAEEPSLESTLMDGTNNLSNNMVIQQHLIALFFRHRYATFPIIPKRILYEHLERRGYLCTPLLLYAIYAQAAHFADDDRSQANVYYSHAVALVDDYLEIPRLSTIVALCLLSLYEQPTDSNNNGYNATQARSQAYSSIAFRMCFDLGLHKRYVLNQRLNRGDVELHKRIFWSCYCLDKMQNVCVGRPWMIMSKDVDLDLPLLQPGDDIEEQEVLEYFSTLIKLFQICEHAFQTDSAHAARSIVRSYDQEQLAYTFDNSLLMWLRSLPTHLQWTPFPTQANAVATQPPPNAMIAHLHLFYNVIELGVLRPHSAMTGKTILHRCSTIATNITQLACSLAEQTNFILSYSFVASAIMAAVRVHLLNCSNENMNFARHSRFMFQRSLRSLRTLYQVRKIQGVPEFVSTLKSTMAAADTNTEIEKQQQEQEDQFEQAPTSPTQAQQLIMNRATAAFSAHTLTAAAAHASASASLAVARQHKATLSIPSSHNNNNNSNNISSNNNNSNNPQNIAHANQQLSTNMVFDPNTGSWRPPNQNIQPELHHQHHQQQQQQHHQQHHHHQQQQQQQQQPQQRVPYPLNLLSVDENWSKPAEPSVDSILKDKVFATFMDEHNKNSIKMNNQAATSTDIDELVAQMRFGSKAEDHDDTNGGLDNKNTTWNNAAAAAAAAAAVSAAENDSLVYSMWAPTQQDGPSSSTRDQRDSHQREQPPPTSPSVASSTSHSQSTPYQSTYMNIGLGVYASAHQHHTDVIRQHFPGVESRSNPSVRPVILTHQGHVIVAGSNQDTTSTPPHPQ
ncbi:fungal-specific transcription factor domain-containing protein [Phascolomyces articulosus]|uniref:Fungal-specific transcription factor domain-containing protein n=1 Tax=Phascolomyces articulosus TaxID=60185 RepID=A0AAD5PFV0_9FUNG|nr:fungal-specific transcription factor domain-containing protein [Phascolomyces articulosus]